MSTRSSPPNIVLRAARFGHTPSCTPGSHTCAQCLPTDPAGVVKVTASSSGAVFASESASICNWRTWLMNIGIDIAAPLLAT